MGFTQEHVTNRAYPWSLVIMVSNDVVYSVNNIDMDNYNETMAIYEGLFAPKTLLD